MVTGGHERRKKERKKGKPKEDAADGAVLRITLVDLF